MLHAILNGKAGRVDVKGESIPVRKIYRDSEDMITAAVISRLPYLTPETRHTLLSRCLPESKQDYRLLDKVEFWPRFNSKVQKWVEPDVIMHFDWGILLIEAKRPTLREGQYLDQWWKEIEAVTKEHHDKRIAFLALGGDQRYNQQLLNKLQEQLLQSSHRIEEALELGWSLLSAALQSIDDDIDIPASDLAVVTDIKAALELYGVSCHPDLKTLPTDTALRESTLSVISNWHTAPYFHALTHINDITIEGIKTWNPLQ